MRRWLEPFLAGLSHPARRRMCPLYIAGLIGPGDRKSCLQVKFTSIKTLPPVGKRKHYSPQVLTYVRALETDPPAGRLPIDWKLVTNLPVTNLAGAIERLDWYALRWKMEVFHKVVQSGCRAEDSRLQTAERLVKFLALITVVSWRIFFVTVGKAWKRTSSSCALLISSAGVPPPDSSGPASRRVLCPNGFER